MRRIWIMLLAFALTLFIALPAGAGRPPVDCDKLPNHPACATDPGDDTPIAGKTCTEDGSIYGIQTSDFDVILSGESDFACIDVMPAEAGAWKVTIGTEGTVRRLSLSLRDSAGPGDGCFEGGSCGYLFRRDFPSVVEFPYIDGAYVNVCGTEFAELVWDAELGDFVYYADADETVASPLSFFPSMSGKDGSVVRLHIDLPPLGSP